MNISEQIKGLSGDITVATVCSHSSLQIFHGAKKEGFKTLGICKGKPPAYYDAFPLARPDEFFTVKEYTDLLKKSVVNELQKKNCIVVPHGSFVEYMKPENFEKLQLPTFGNRKVLAWESDRNKEREWLEYSGLKMPKEVKNPKDIKGPAIVKYHGAKGGRGFFIASDYNSYNENVRDEPHTIQEFIPGARFYFHYFYSPIKEDGYKLSKGSLEMLSIDRRVESNIDELYRWPDNTDIGFTVVGNVPLVLRESLLPKVFKMGKDVVEKSIKLFGGLTGPFCLECIIDKDLNIYCFEISARIVAGTNPFITGSPYADFIQPELSTGRRIAQELKLAMETGKLKEILS